MSRGRTAAAFLLLACGGGGENAPGQRPQVEDAAVAAERTARDTAVAMDQPRAEPDAARPVDVAASPVDVAASPVDAMPARDAAADAVVPAECTPRASLACDTLGPLPATLKEAGLEGLPTGARRFVPRWELWSDGLGKDRYVIVPAGKKIDSSKRETWVFPVGVLFVKTFFADGVGGARRPVETRVIRRTADPDPYNQYEFGVYLWNDAGTDARRLDLADRTPVPVTVGGQRFTHQIPSKLDCARCHGEKHDTVVLGFDELRLNSTLPGAAKTQLAVFHDQGLFSAPLPANPDRIPVDPASADLEPIKGFIHGNCAHCHNDTDPQIFDMRHAVLVQNSVRKRTIGSGTAEGWRILPGQPDMSIVYLQTARMMRVGINPMPPIGVQRADPEAVTRLRRWIMSLP